MVVLSMDYISPVLKQHEKGLINPTFEVTYDEISQLCLQTSYGGKMSKHVGRWCCLDCCCSSLASLSTWMLWDSLLSGNRITCWLLQRLRNMAFSRAGHHSRSTYKHRFYHSLGHCGVWYSPVGPLYHIQKECDTGSHYHTLLWLKNVI